MTKKEEKRSKEIERLYLEVAPFDDEFAVAFRGRRYVIRDYYQIYRMVKTCFDAGYKFAKEEKPEED